MMKSDLNDEDTPVSLPRYFAHLTLWSMCLAFVLIAAVVVAIAVPHAFGHAGGTDMWIVLLGSPIVLAGGFALWRTAPDFTMGEPRTPRGNRMRWLLVAIVVAGIAISVPIILADDGQGRISLWSNSPMPQTAALIAAGLWALTMPLLMVASRRVADEHTRAATDFGMMVGFQTFAYAAPIWWMGWRGGFLPQPDVMILFIIASVLSSGANLWKRFA